MRELHELGRIDRERLAARMQGALAAIRDELGAGLGELSEMSGIEEGRLRSLENGTDEIRWDEFLALLFIFWENDRGIVEREGLFPKGLRAILSIDRNAHAPTPI